MALLPVDDRDDLEDPLAVFDAHGRCQARVVPASYFVADLALALLRRIELTAADRIDGRPEGDFVFPVVIISLQRITIVILFSNKD